MRIYKYIHSCLLIEEGSKKILIDPGTFSFIEKKFSADDFRGISAILITHAHGDHIDKGVLKTIVENYNAVVISNSEVKEFLQSENIPVQILEEGELTIDGFHIEAIPAEHERIPGNAPQNTAYIINKTILHPGDSLSSKLLEHKGTPILALPVIAPWNKRFEAIEFAKNFSPKVAIPIHDGFVKEFFQNSQDGIYKDALAESNIDYRPLNAPDQFVEMQ